MLSALPRRLWSENRIFTYRSTCALPDYTALVITAHWAQFVQYSVLFWYSRQYIIRFVRRNLSCAQYRKNIKVDTVLYYLWLFQQRILPFHRPEPLKYWRGRIVL